MTNYAVNLKNKMEELLASNEKLAELLHLKKEEEIEEEKKNKAVYVFAILGAIAVIGIVAYLVYKYVLNPVVRDEGELADEYEEYDDSEFEDEVFEDEDYVSEEEIDKAFEQTEASADEADV